MATHAGHAGHAHHHGAHGDHGGRLRTSVHATVHCLVGCSIGEFAGLSIGVALGLGTTLTLTLAVVLSFIAGLNLAVQPLMREQGMSYLDGIRTIWLGETVSIAAMEVAMNVTDYLVGGVQVGSLASPMFWAGFVAALPVGFLAALPVNYWLIGRNLKHCH
ncbi:hypothetical protein KBTX_01822 [wastewater metagenome]|uniref:DUF4396 domain-containing protein n=2 Tax=unclassified sequences TaxID=12908 RepID=A0A5B8R8N7_9ZZZZ|nr:MULTISPECIES: DUF4396 domain-containing protein [Arhodomonas]QEA05499.1 hypothetical protein KBTEX_01822 [uncultured organism]